MRNLTILILVTSFIYSCQSQNTQQLDWETYLKPIIDQKTELVKANEMLFDSLVLKENNPLHKKYLAFREVRINQHRMIDSLNNLLDKKNIDYTEVLKSQRKLLTQNDNLEKLKAGEMKLADIAKSIYEFKDNQAVKTLLTLKDIKREELLDDSQSAQYQYAYHLLHTSQYLYLNFDNMFIEMMPRLNEIRRGSGHPEFEHLDVSKYNCWYKKNDENVTLGDHKDKVLKIIGQPTSVKKYNDDDSTKYYLYYKYDHILLQADTVIGWDNKKGSLKIKLESAIDTDKIKYITIGTPKCEVLALYGTPRMIEKKVVHRNDRLYSCHEIWGYGKAYDDLYFSYKDEVMAYSNRDGSFDIRLKSSDTQDEYFTIGSTREDVAAISGSPSRLTTNKKDYKETWTFRQKHKSASIEFKDGKVLSVWNEDGILKFKF